MPRGKFKVSKPTLTPDPVYQSVLVHKFINTVMRDGKKETARRAVYKSFDRIKEITKKEPLEVFEQAVKNASPLLEVRSKRVGGATYQVPMEVRPERKMQLSFRWIVDAAANKQGKSLDEFLAQEILDSFKGEGSAIKKRDEMHRAAEANRAFAHFARF